MKLEAGAMLKQYRLVEPAGEGGMGVVWKAEDTVLGRTVAVKVLPAEVSRDEKRRRMFLDEARLASSLSEANIAAVHEFAREGDLDFIVMEFVEGRPLTKLLQGRPLPPEKVADWGHQVGRALSRAHRKGLLHRDIKPANILVTPEGDVKVVDFGVAVLFDRGTGWTGGGGDDDATSLKTVTTMRESGSKDAVAGTLPYMSPEQVRGEKLGVHSDIFSLGTVLYEMTTGRRPFAARTSDELAEAISQARPVPAHDLVPEVPLDLDRIISKAMAPRPSDRYQTMEDLAVDLKRLGKDLESGTSPTYGDLKRPEAPGRRLPAKLIAVVAVAAAILLAGAAVAVRYLGGESGAGAAAQVGERTVLVWPLDVRGQADGAEYVGQSFAEAVAVTLAQAKDLKVLPVPEGRGGGAAERSRAAREQGAGLLLTGSLTRSGQVIHASLSVVDTVENRIVWGAQREAPEGDLSGLASSLAREGVEALSPFPTKIYYAPLELTGGPAMAASPLTAEALGTLRRREVQKSLDATARLVAAYPSELDAHVLRAVALRFQWRDDSSDDAEESLYATLETIKRLDPDSPYPDMFRLYTGGGGEKRMESMRRLLARQDISPELRFDTLSIVAWMRRDKGNIEGAVAAMEEAVRIFPANAKGLSDLGYFLREAGRAEEGLRRARQAVSLEPASWNAHHNLGHVLVGLGRHVEAAGAYMRACDLGKLQRPCAAAAGSLLLAGKREEALEVAARADSMTDSRAGAYNLACFWAQAGDKEKAIGHLRRALDLGWASNWLAEDPDLEPLRGEPGFQEILAINQERIDKGSQPGRPRPDEPTP